MIETRKSFFMELQKHARENRSGIVLNSHTLGNTDLGNIDSRFKNAVKRGGSIVIDISGQMFSVGPTKLK